MPTNTYDELQRVTVGVATNTVTFNSIPGTYTDLRIVVDGTAASNSYCTLRFNADTANNYSNTEIVGDGSTAGSFRNTNNAYAYTGSIFTGQTNNLIDIFNYSNSTISKTFFHKASFAGNSIKQSVGLWRSTSAITSITIGTGGATNFNVGSTFSLYGIKAWAPETTPKATGGYVYQDSTYWYHSFPFSGTFTPNQSLSCDYLVVAGGGGGPGGGGGGGGAGGLRSTVTSTGRGGVLESALSLTAQNYTVTVGAGGVGATGNGGNGLQGSNSVFANITSIGGGLGPHNTTGGNGGSGGGGGYGATVGGSGTSGQGYNGGNGGDGAPNYTSGGGGGAGAAGQNASGANGGAGGDGVWTALSNALSIGQLFNGNYYVAGGGAGGTNSGTKSGGLGGGGSTTRATDGISGMSSTGGGAGAASPGWSTTNTKGGNGGSGLVIVRYAK
jgi:hypothetical protein